MIQWISEEVLQKEEVLAESNCNDYLSYQDREELERKGEKKIVTGLSKQGKWRKENETKRAGAGGMLTYSVRSRLYWGLASGEAETWVYLAECEGDDSTACVQPGGKEASDENLKCSILVGRYTRLFKLKKPLWAV